MLQIVPRNLSNKLAVVLFALFLSFTVTSCFKETDIKQIDQQTGVLQMSPASGPKNTVVSISGVNFPDKSGVQVKINGKAATVVAGTSNNLQVQVPQGAGSGKVEVAFGGSTYDAGTFTYENTYTVTSLTNGIPGLLNGSLATARFEDIESSAIDASDNLYVADFSGSNNLRKINLTTSTVTTLATLTPGGGVEFLTTDAAGNVYAADQGARRIVKVTPTGTVTNLITVPFKTQGVKVGASGNVYVSGSTDIAKYSPTGTLIWRLTSHGGSGNVDGDTSVVKFNLYGNIEVDASETKIYVVQNAGPIKVLDLTAKTLKAFAGSTAGFADGPALDAKFAFVYSITLDKTGGMYIADADNGAIRYLKNGQVSTIIGGNGAGDREGAGTAVQFGYPQHVSIDSKGNLYVSDYNNLKIYKVIVD